MTDEGYDINIDPADGLIVATLTGLWTCDIIDRYKIHLLIAGAKLMAVGIDPAKISILIDTRDFSPQPKEVVAYYTNAFGEPRFQSERIAVLYGSTLLKMQTRRMAIGTPRFFKERDEAIDWLRSLN